MMPVFETYLLAVVVAVACALPGVFLVLRGMAMMSDAISHAILPGIVVAFFLTHDLASPWLILGAGATGVLTVALVELLHRTGLVREDTAIGLVFPALFSIGVVLIARYAGDVHLDVDAVLLGELAFAYLDRVAVGGEDLGPKGLWLMGGILVLNVAFLSLFYKELKLATFDPALAAALGFAPVALHYALMGLVSVTAVGAFDAVGSILVVALMVGPGASAFLLTDRLDRMLGLSVVLAAAAAVGGCAAAFALDVSIAGCVASAVGVLFGGVLLLAPERGLVALARRRARQRKTFAAKMLVIHLAQHEGTAAEARESRVAHLQEHLRWDARKAEETVDYVLDRELARQEGEHLRLTPAGRALAREAVVAT